ncbi:MAG: protease SohB [SAR324 cluster bacterium]|jgi:serine protease SohB|uniref:Protease SohB n=1 Tax=SAR324 cluster bacterium TaxID=2024889 RepID=A0A432GL22_9DELT|nr:MAG: protease SohB [SAR324 cluster bacterium]
MNEFMEQYWSFYNAGVTIFLIAGLALIIKLVFFKRKRRKKEPHLKFKHWNQRFENDFERLEKELHVAPFLPKEATKLLMKARKKEVKEEKRIDKEKSVKTISTIREKLKDGLNSEEVLKQHSNCVYVLTFIGSIMASEVEQLRDQISFLLQIAQPADEIVVRLTSPGGAVPQYGLASSQLERLKQAGLRCVVCVDTVAASGGYMMAAVADKIIAAPFAIIGSIGVVAGIPNFHRVLQKNEVDYHLFTAGKYKRTVTPFTEVTDEGKQKLQDDITAIHEAFKRLIKEGRPDVDIEEIATGEYWLASQAKEKGLVDEIMTSDDYLGSKLDDCEVIEITTETEQNRLEKLIEGGASLFRQWTSSRIPGAGEELEDVRQRFR